MSTLLTLVAAVFNAVLVAAAARRLLGVPVGWPRSILLGLCMSAAVTWSIAYLGEATGVLAGGRLAVSQGSAVAVMVLVTAWVFALGLTGLIVAEALVPTGTLPTPIAMVRGLAGRRRRAVRYGQIVGIAARHGLGGYLRGTRRADPLTGPATIARSVRDALNEGGVTFVKLGQMLSTRRDLLPAAFVDQLATLQTRADPQPWPVLAPAVEAALGRPIGDVFGKVDPEPLASASVAQVHAAWLLDGRPVVLKVQRPGARRQVTADVEIILRLAQRLERATAWGRSLGVLRLARGFAASLEEELDYRVELDNQRSVAATLGHGVVVPAVHEQHSGSQLLVMDRLDGVPVGDADALLARFDPATRREMADRLLGEVLRQIVMDGVFHADLHPGNILVLADGRLGLLDFGSVGRLDASTRTALGLLLVAIDRNDAIAATDALIEMLGRPDGLRERDLERDLGRLMVRYRTGLGSAGGAGVFGGVLRLVQEHRFAIPPQVAAAFRALAALDGTLTQISPDLDLVAAARAHGQALMGQATSPRAVRATLESSLAGYLPLLQRLPRKINKLTEELEEGRLSVNVRLLADERDRGFLTSLVQQLVLAVLAAAAIISSIVLLAVDTGPLMTPGVRLYAVLGATMLLPGLLLALRCLAPVFRPR